MDFRLTQDQQFFIEQVFQTLRRRAVPEAESIDKNNIFPARLFEELGHLGYYGIRYPAEIGGMGADCVTFTILAEELAKDTLRKPERYYH
ncbi:MAG TPA: acyl-CoA dehydrogenase family protein [Syntrophales bacterium]|nr:acyl-CoA dehydrogenase family protein [Syntrophales bacterium]